MRKASTSSRLSASPLKPSKPSPLKPRLFNGSNRKYVRKGSTDARKGSIRNVSHSQVRKNSRDPPSNDILRYPTPPLSAKNAAAIDAEADILAANVTAAATETHSCAVSLSRNRPTRLSLSLSSARAPVHVDHELQKGLHRDSSGILSVQSPIHALNRPVHKGPVPQTDCPEVLRHQRVVLLSIDGLNQRNFYQNSKTPTLDMMKEQFFFSSLKASGDAVGLIDGAAGSREIGHMTLGMGRACVSNSLRIEQSLKAGTFSSNVVLQSAMSAAREGTGRLHLLGLLNADHLPVLKACLSSAQEMGVQEAYVHAFTSGKSTAGGLIQHLQAHFNSTGYGVLASVTGRYFAMDKDLRWDRTKTAFECLVKASGDQVDCDAELQSLLDTKYGNGETDEFLRPLILHSTVIQGGDVVIFTNQSSDGLAQLVQALCAEELSLLPFPCSTCTNGCRVFTMAATATSATPLFAPAIENSSNGLAEWISKANLKLFFGGEMESIASQCLYGGVEERQKDWEGIELKIHESQVAGASTRKVATSIVDAIADRSYSLVIGHLATSLPSHVDRCDEAVQIILDACMRFGCILVVTSAFTRSDSPQNQGEVPLLIAADPAAGFKAQAQPPHSVSLTDLAPTVLELMGISIPFDMTGIALIAKHQ